MRDIHRDFYFPHNTIYTISAQFKKYTCSLIIKDEIKFAAFLF